MEMFFLVSVLFSDQKQVQILFAASHRIFDYFLGISPQANNQVDPAAAFCLRNMAGKHQNFWKQEGIYIWNPIFAAIGGSFSIINDDKISIPFPEQQNGIPFACVKLQKAVIFKGRKGGSVLGHTDRGFAVLKIISEFGRAWMNAFGELPVYRAADCHLEIICEVIEQAGFEEENC